MKTGPETETGLSTHATPVIPLLCLVGVVLLLSSVTPVIKYVFQHSHLHPIRLASFRVMIGFLALLTITWLWEGGGFEFALVSYMEWEEAGRPIDYVKWIASVEPRERPDRPGPWHNVR